MASENFTFAESSRKSSLDKAMRTFALRGGLVIHISARIFVIFYLPPQHSGCNYYLEKKVGKELTRSIGSVTTEVGDIGDDIAVA
jgi:putative flippase GtrA